MKIEEMIGSLIEGFCGSMLLLHLVVNVCYWRIAVGNDVGCERPLSAPLAEIQA